jgi:hypothetical protein
MPDPRPAARAQLLGVFDIRGCDADGGQDGDASRGRWRHVCTAPRIFPRWVSIEILSAWAQMKMTPPPVTTRIRSHYRFRPISKYSQNTLDLPNCKMLMRPDPP